MRAFPLILAGLAVVLVTGCSSSPSSPSSPSTAAAPSAAPASGDRIGAAGSACEFPVSFEVAERWLPKAVAVAPGDELAALVTRGPLTVVCEIDAKPAGTLGFIRVWTDPTATGTPRATLDTFLTGGSDEVRSRVFADATLAGMPATEVTYRLYNTLLEEERDQRALAVGSTAGVVVIELGGLDSAEHAAMLPAFELAKRTLAA